MLVHPISLMTVYGACYIYMYINIVLLSGAGLGIHTMPTLTIVSLYFKKYLSVGLGICMAGVGLGCFIFPTLVTFLEQQYGWRGTLLIVGGITLNLTVVGALYRPLPQTARDKDQTEHSTSPGLHLAIFFNLAYIMLIINATINWMAITIVVIHLGEYVKFLHYSSKQAALVISAMGLANCVGRLLWGFLNQVPAVTPLRLYFVCYLLQGIATILLPMVDAYLWVLCYGVLFGLLQGSISVAMPQILAQAIGMKLMGVGYGYKITITSVACMAGGPIAGKKNCQ